MQEIVRAAEKVKRSVEAAKLLAPPSQRGAARAAAVSAAPQESPISEVVIVATRVGHDGLPTSVAQVEETGRAPPSAVVHRQRPPTILSRASSPSRRS